MKRAWKEVLLAVGLGVGAPWLILGIAAAGTEPALQTQTTEGVMLTQPHLIQVLTQNGTVEMDLEEYLVGVLLCEIPESFDQEAKKAQAVVARTYTLRTVTHKDKHPFDAVCTSPDCCQGYVSAEAYTGSRAGVESARRAVSDTEGLVLTYDRALIDATYFSCSGGMTEDAVAVWGADVPYLKAVSSPGEEQATHYTDTVIFSSEGFQEALGLKLQGKPGYWLGEVTYTAGGGVDTMVIGGKSYQGTELRKALGLRSTAFTMTAAGDSVIITTKGFGHRVGMSQYGAEAMAVNGSGYEEILKHYYQGTSLTMIGP